MHGKRMESPTLRSVFLFPAPPPPPDEAAEVRKGKKSGSFFYFPPPRQRETHRVVEVIRVVPRGPLGRLHARLLLVIVHFEDLRPSPSAICNLPFFPLRNTANREGKKKKREEDNRLSSIAVSERSGKKQQAGGGLYVPNATRWVLLPTPKRTLATTRRFLRTPARASVTLNPTRTLTRGMK